MPWACAGLLPPISWPRPARSPRDMANSTELGELTLGLGKEGQPCIQGQSSQCHPGCASLPPLQGPPLLLPTRWVLILISVSFSWLIPCSPWAVSWLQGRLVSTISPLAAPGRAVLPSLLGGRGPRDRSTALAWGWLLAGSGRRRLGLFSSLFARPWGRPAMRIKAGVLRAANCHPAQRGGRGAAAPGLSQPCRGLPCQHCPAGNSTRFSPPKHKAERCQQGPGMPTESQYQVFPWLGRAPHIPPLWQLGSPGAGGHGSLSPECQCILLCFSH